MHATLPYDPRTTWQALAWAKKHCPSYITNAVHEEDLVTKKLVVGIDFFFSDERDVVLFLLRWS